jgi:DNA replication protein DnaC
VFVPVTKYLSEIKATWGQPDRDEDEVIARYQEVEVLCLDDIAKAPVSSATEWTPAKVFELVDGRCRAGRATFISSNASLGQLAEKFGTDFGPDIASRIVGMTVTLHFKGPDRRFPRQP